MNKQEVQEEQREREREIWKSGGSKYFDHKINRARLKVIIRNINFSTKGIFNMRFTFIEWRKLITTKEMKLEEKINENKLKGLKLWELTGYLRVCIARSLRSSPTFYSKTLRNPPQISPYLRTTLIETQINVSYIDVPTFNYPVQLPKSNKKNKSYSFFSSSQCISLNVC